MKCSAASRSPMLSEEYFAWAAAGGTCRARAYCVSAIDLAVVVLMSIRMTRMILSGTMTAVSLGLGSAILFAVLYGTAALPFLVGSSVGFGLGAVSLGRTCIGLTRVLMSGSKFKPESSCYRASGRRSSVAP